MEAVSFRRRRRLRVLVSCLAESERNSEWPTWLWTRRPRTGKPLKTSGGDTRGSQTCCTSLVFNESRFLKQNSQRWGWKSPSKSPDFFQNWLYSQVGSLYSSVTQRILPSCPSCTAPLATSWRAAGNILCSANFTLSDRVATVSPLFTGTDSCKIICPASTSSCRRKKFWTLFLASIFYI